VTAVGGIDRGSRKVPIGEETGQSLVVVLLAIPVLLLFVALVIDGGNLVVQKRQLQTAADAAALAAAQSLTPVTGTCDTGSTCHDVILVGYSQKNGGSSTMPPCTSPTMMNCYVAPYKGTPGLIEVRLRKQVGSLFAGLLGAAFHVAARAVASANPLTSITDPTTTESTSPGFTDSGSVTTVTNPGTTSPGGATTYTVGTTVFGENDGGVGFAMSTDCPAISYTGAGQGDIGALETNGGVRITGNDNKSISSLGVGRLRDPGCFLNSAPAVIGNLYGPFAPKPWPLPPPPVPTPPGGCTSLFTNSVVTNRSRTTNVATLTTAAAHDLLVGTTVTIAGVGSGFDGSVTVTAVPTATTFRYANTGPDVASTSSGGTVTPTSGPYNIGTGWSTTHAPGVYCLPGTGLLTLGAVNLAGGAGYTFFAYDINASSGTFKNYTPAPGQPPTVFYASHNFVLNGGGASVTGFIFAPNGEIRINGGGVSAGEGYLESQTIVIAGNFANFLGRGPGTGGTVTTTVVTSTTPGTTSPGSVTTVTTPGTTIAGTVSTTTIPGTTITTGSTIGLDE
jgi:Flp pilus assembly protein TadG